MSSRKFGLNLVVVLAIAALFTGFWALVNRPVSAPNWPQQISGFSYSPFQQGQYPQRISTRLMTRCAVIWRS